MSRKNRIFAAVLLALAGAVISVLLFVPPPASAAEGEYVYRVKAGDSLYLIAARFGTSVSDLMAANHLTSDMIMVDQVLTLPASSLYVEYIVQPGDTLYLISKQFSTAVEKLKTLNKLVSDTIYPGQALVVPRCFVSYTVKAGDTLYLLGQRYGVTVEDLMKINRLSSTTLLVGQVLLVPSYVPSRGEVPRPPTVSWQIPAGTVLVHVAAGESLWDLAQRYNTTMEAIKLTNHLHSDILRIGQPLFVPVNSSSPAAVEAPTVKKLPGYGEWLDWEYAAWIFDPGSEATVKDLVTGKQFRVKRYGGSNHADCEPLTSSDTAIMHDIYGGSWSWARRAVLVYTGGRVLAASMNGMPHGGEEIMDNNFSGHFCIHFLNSRTHGTNVVDPEHQAMVQKAAGY